ncbi:DegT/DnrJ/EryC1/StrS family aminotransferase, partial [Acidobacteriota bacterium]
MSFSIPLFDVNFDEREVESVAETVRSKWISMGRNVARLEEEMARRLGVENVVAVSSCTAALHLALLVAGVGPGDEVILPSLTFVATANAVKYVGGTPVFADIVDLEDPTLNPDEIEHLVGPSTKAIIPVHYAGFPCHMNRLMEMADRHGLKVIEDAAHAIDVPLNGRKLGTYGDFGCFSLFANKVITAGEGGFVVAQSSEAAARLRLLRSHGMTTVSWDRARGHASSYDVVDVGFNYRMDDIRAALALAQLEKLDRILARRKQLRCLYLELLSDYPWLIIPFRTFDGPTANYIFPVILSEGGRNRRESVRSQLHNAGIQTSVHYPPVHQFSVYNAGRELPQTENFADQEITL